MQVSEFNSMIQEETGYLMPFAINLTGNPEDAKDLIQETIYRALSNSEKYVDGTNLKAWMYTIMRNIFINNYRRRAKQNTIFDNTPNDFLIDHNQSAVPNSAETNMRIKDIERAVYNLPALFKKPFMLYFEGYKYHEIAIMLDEPLGTIKSRIHFARRLLKEEISKF